MERDYGTPQHQQHGGTPAARSASRTNRRGGSNQLGVLREGTRTRSPAPRIPGLMPDASSATAAQRTMNRRSTQSPQSLPTTNTSVSQPGQSHSRRPQQQQQQQPASNSTEPSWRQRPSMAATALTSDGAAAFTTTQGRPSRRTSSPSGNSPDEDRRRCQRDKQISFGYATDGYVNMERLIRHDPLLKSGGLLPLSPPTIGKGSKRMWDIQVRKWRRALHMFDFVFIDGEDDPATQATVLEEQRQQWVSEAFHGAPREMRQTISLAALRRVQGSPAVPTKIPVERDLRCILRSEDCYEAVSSVVPQSASSLTKGTDISPLEAGIKIHIAPSSAVLQRQLAQKELQQHLASLHQQQQQQQSMSSSAEQTEALPAASVSTPPRQHRNPPLAGSTPQPASVHTGREEAPRSPSPRPPQQPVVEMVRCEGERHPSLAAHQHEQHAHQGVGHHNSPTTAAEMTSGSNATTASAARMAAPPASSSLTTRRSDMTNASASHHAPPQSTQPSPSRFFHEPIPLTDAVAPPRPPAGAVLAPPPPFSGAAAMPWCEPHAAAADGMRFMYAMPSNFAAATAAGGGGGVQVVAQSCAAPGAPWVPPQLPIFANPSALQMPLSVMLPSPPGHMMAASLSASFPYYEASLSGRVVGTLSQPMMVQQQQQGSVLYGVYPSSMERTSAEAHTPAAAPARDGDRRRNSSNSAAATGTPQTIPRFVARLSTSPSERRLGEQHQQQQQQRSSMQKSSGEEGKEDAEDSPCMPHTRPSPPTPPSQNDTQRSAERVSPKSPSVVPPLPQQQPHAQPQPSLSAWTPERVLFGSGAATASTEARTVRAGDSLEGSDRDASLKQRAESSNEDVVAAHLNFQMEAA